MDQVQTFTRVPRSLRRVQERFVSGNSVSLLRDGAQAYPSMLEAIAAAKRQVLFEMYWFDSDRVGRRFAQALIDAAARGVEVALLYDSLGSWEANREMFAEIERAGVHVIEYNPIAPWKHRFRIDRMTRRDHRKIVIVDGRVGFTGGINLANPWLPEGDERAPWRDDMIRVEGPCVAAMIECFLVTWRDEGGRNLENLEPVETCDEGELKVRVLGENFKRHRREILHAYLSNIYRAQRRVFITNAYFVPDLAVVRALKRAARRGVDVRVLLPSESDVPIVKHASRAMWGGLMKSGVRLFEWLPSILHSKSAVIDGRWSTIGSFNLDYQSLRNNLEINVAVLDEAFGAVMEASFERDLEQSREIDAHEFRFRPLGHRLLELVLYGFRKVL
jgi:cardiolipin synthase A/B